MIRRTLVFWLVLSLGALVVLAGCTSAQPSPTDVAQAPASAARATEASTQAPAPTAAPTKGPVPTAAPTKAPAKVVTPDLGEVSFEQVVTVPNAPPQTIKMYIKRQNMRLEMEADGEDLVWLVNGQEQAAYMWMRDQNVAMKMSMAQFEDQQTLDVDVAEVGERAASGKLLGSETIDGKECDVYEYTADEGTAKTWIWREKGFPLRTEVTTPQGKVTSEFKNVQFGGVADDLFVLPGDVQVMDFGSLPGMLPTPRR